MRKIEQEMIAAIQAGKTWHKENTTVTVNTREDGAKITSVYLHGNLIAQNGKDGAWGFCLCGWNTPTTRSRINAVITGCTDDPYRGVSQKKGQPILSWRKFGGLIYEWKAIPTDAWFSFPV